ncbi:MAG: GNAT family N-acetyltransferase [Anaerolineae bacterium]|nr:GNAT family N-acetyltransferase [Anaerolineae bacterium]
MRCYREGEGATFFDLVQRNIEHFRIAVPENWLTIPGPDDAENLIREFIGAWIQHQAFFFSMWDRATNTLLGHIPLFDPNWQVPRIEVGYILGQEYQGKGYMTEGVRACVRFAFDHLNMNKMLLYCREDNVPSYRLAERVGFKREGLQHDHILRPDGTLTGRLCYGMTVADYQELVTTWE